MAFRRHKRSDPSLIPMRDGSEAVRAQVGLLAEEVHLQFAALEQALKREFRQVVADSEESIKAEIRTTAQSRG